MSYQRLLAVISMLGLHSASAAELPACDISETASVHFSSEESADVLAVSISGKPCYEATLVATIASENGERWYHYEARFKPHTAVHWEDPSLDKDAEQEANEFVADESFGLTSELPEWLPEAEYYDAHYQVIQISKSEYEELRQHNWVTYTHSIHYEGWRVIAFDRDEQRTIIVSEGTL